MKFKTGEQVIVLNTKHRLAGTGKIITYYALSGEYKILFKFPHAIKTKEINIAEERLVFSGVIPRVECNTSKQSHI